MKVTCIVPLLSLALGMGLASFGCKDRPNEKAASSAKKGASVRETPAGARPSTPSTTLDLRTFRVMAVFPAGWKPDKTLKTDSYPMIYHLRSQADTGYGLEVLVADVCQGDCDTVAKNLESVATMLTDMARRGEMTIKFHEDRALAGGGRVVRYTLGGQVYMQLLRTVYHYRKGWPRPVSCTVKMRYNTDAQRTQRRTMFDRLTKVCDGLKLIPRTTATQ